MSRIPPENTKPERKVRSLLHQMGYRFRLHQKDLPGTPDIVLKKYITVVEVRGCYFHRHKGCRNCTTPGTNKEFWQQKFFRNQERDRRNKLALKRLGWKTVVVWECEVKNEQKLRNKLRRALPAR